MGESDVILGSMWGSQRRSCAVRMLAEEGPGPSKLWLEHFFNCYNSCWPSKFQCHPSCMKRKIQNCTLRNMATTS